jgi:hypothetical protein
MLERGEGEGKLAKMCPAQETLRWITEIGRPVRLMVIRDCELLRVDSCVLMPCVRIRAAAGEFTWDLDYICHRRNRLSLVGFMNVRKDGQASVLLDHF